MPPPIINFWNSCHIYITISDFTSVCPYGGVVRRHVTSHFRLLSCSYFQRPSQTAAEWGVAELRILDFKTTWSEFQQPSQIAAEWGEAELLILDFETTWSEFQIPSQSWSQAVVCVITPRMYPRSWYFLVYYKCKKLTCELWYKLLWRRNLVQGLHKRWKLLVEINQFLHNRDYNNKLQIPNLQLFSEFQPEIFAKIER